MANSITPTGAVESFVTSANVTAVVFTADAFGNLAYSSGGIRQYEMVTLDTATGNPKDVKLAVNGAANLPLGVALDGPATGPGRSLLVQVSGVSKVRASGAVTVGDLVAVNDTSGRVGTAAAAAATSAFIVGRALTAATQVDDILEVQLLIGASQVINA